LRLAIEANSCSFENTEDVVGVLQTKSGWKIWEIAMVFETLEWVGGVGGYLEMIDQRLLPGEFLKIRCTDVESLYDAIKTLAVRGAPAIGVAAGYGVCIAVQGLRGGDLSAALLGIEKAVEYLGCSRPTAVNLFWALDRMAKVLENNPDLSVAKIIVKLTSEAVAIMNEDKTVCRQIGKFGSRLLPSKCTVLTHCNAGGLATADYGTALGVIYSAYESGKEIKVYADETRPLLQGSRLTAWELMHSGIEVTLICDNMAAKVMSEGKIDVVVVGADRIAANGDTANKIGTYMAALCAKYHNIPFYVAAPSSTFDLSLESGKKIPIEERAAEEITCGFGKRTAPEGIKVYSPAFDVTPAELITAYITEKGVIKADQIIDKLK